VFEVNRSSYYAWRQRQGKTNPEREALKVVLIKYHKASRGSAGARTLSEDCGVTAIRWAATWPAV